MLNHFKFYNTLFNGMALLLMAAGMIVGPFLENSTLVSCFTAVGTVVKEWNDFKKYSFKVDMSRFAFTTYAKASIKLRTYAREIPFEGLGGFLIKVQTLDDTVIDFTPPLPKRCMEEYYRHFVYQQVDAQCYVDGCHRPLMSKSHWVEKDKKVDPYSPTLMYSTLMYSAPWLPEEENKKRKRKSGPRTQQGEGMPWVVDVKKGYEVTRNLINALKKPQMSAAESRKVIAGYKREYQEYKRRGGKQGYLNWARGKCYIKKPNNKCSIQ